MTGTVLSCGTSNTISAVPFGAFAHRMLAAVMEFGSISTTDAINAFCWSSSRFDDDGDPAVGEAVQSVRACAAPMKRVEKAFAA